MSVYRKTLSKARSAGELSAPLTGTSMLLLLLGQALESSTRDFFTVVPFALVLLCLWAPLFRRESS